MEEEGQKTKPEQKDSDLSQDSDAPSAMGPFMPSDPKIPLKPHPTTPVHAHIGAYGPTHNSLLDLSRGRWDSEYERNAGKLIQDSPQGRLAIRTFSRGILGAVFYAGAQHYAKVKLKGYHPDKEATNMVQHVAKFIDNYVGKPIEMTVTSLGYDGQRAVSFRPTKQWYQGRAPGRTLGHEVMGVTFDFSAMSMGDALGRDIAVLVDPNARHQWEDENGKISIPKAVQSLATNTFRYLTYNAGEDWAVALPYVYYTRLQRNMISKFSPGFEYDSDRGFNGGSFKVNNEGRVVGNYMLEGLLDLQGRFTAYNIGTLMYREAYMETAYKIREWEHNGYKIPKLDLSPSNLLKKTTEGIGDLTRWAARDAVKGTIYMTPAVPFFWMSRTPQSKYQGLFINAEKGAMSFVSRVHPEKYYDLVHANEWKRSANQPDKRDIPFSYKTEVHFSRYHPESQEWSISPVANNPITKKGFEPYERTFSTGDAMLNSIGEFNNHFRKTLHGPGEFVEKHFYPGKTIDRKQWKRKSNSYAGAALAYTPYFWAKTEFANLWDNARMDMAIERALDGADKLNLGEFKAGLGEMWQTLRLEPLKDPEREAEAQEAVRTDISPADVFDPQIFRNYERVKDRYDPTHAFHYGGDTLLSWKPERATLAQPEKSASKTAFNSIDNVSLAAPLPEVKKSHVERLERHKATAQSRLEEFKQASEPKRFADAVKKEEPQPVVTKQEEKTSFVEDLAKSRAQPDQPDDGPTLH